MQLKTTLNWVKRLLGFVCGRIWPVRAGEEGERHRLEVEARPRGERSDAVLPLQPAGSGL